MAYTTRAQVETEIPPAKLVEALDDNADGTEDTGMFDALVTGAATEVDGILGQSFSVPFASGEEPAVVKQAALLFVCEKVYRRRGLYGVANPFTAQAKDMRAKLDRIARKEEPLTPAVQSEKPSVSLITEDSRVYSGNGTGVL